MREQGNPREPPSSSPEVSIVIPCLNEADAIPVCVSAVETQLRSANVLEYELLFVDDGSTDDTWGTIVELSREDVSVVGIRLNRNVGKEAALAAGLGEARGRAHIPFDVDLQDPPELLPQMLEEWRNGAKLVQCRRSSREDGRLKRWTAATFYGVAEHGSNVTLPQNVGDFRLMDSSVTVRYLSLPERNRFNKGLFALVAPIDCVTLDFARPAPQAGNSRQPRQSWGKLIGLGVDGIVAFSTWPLRLASLVGLALVVASMVGLVASVALRMADVIEVPGQATVIIVGLLIVGLQAAGMGILGEYVARILTEVKARPLYFIDERVNSEAG